jgi:hypothetical protein
MNVRLARHAAGALIAVACACATAQGLPPKQFELRVSELGSHINGTAGRADGVPLNRRYAELDAQDQALVRAPYDSMPAGDEPPFPAEGLLPVFMKVQAGGEKQPALGHLTLLADVDSSGRVQHVEAFGKVDAEFARFAARVLASTPFKAGRCGGQPCNMQYVLKMQIAGL